MPVLPSKETC